jgi:predicted dehydrogenase
VSRRPKIALIGGGNITNLRHVPALQRVGRADVVGVIGVDGASVARTANRIEGAATAVVNPAADFTAQVRDLAWFDRCDAVVIGTPPRTHHPIATACLALGKHVLTEKPMAMDPAEATDLAAAAAAAGRHLAVMHNFQFARGMRRLEKLLRAGQLGDPVSAFLFQFTTRERRLPAWYRDLPLGLFYDEAAHFFYLCRRLLGPVAVLGGSGHVPADEADETPVLMSVDMRAGDVPVHLFVNFNAPVCEWQFVLSGTRKLAVYDFFRDILVVLPTDGQHLPLDILRTSLSATIQHWSGFVSSGIWLVQGRLQYGVDVVMDRFIDAVCGRPLDPNLSVHAGVATVEAMSAVVAAVRSNSHPIVARG